VHSPSPAFADRRSPRLNSEVKTTTRINPPLTQAHKFVKVEPKNDTDYLDGHHQRMSVSAVAPPRNQPTSP
jgi:hypothetical protein